MPISYDMLFGAPTDEEKMRAAADRLRRREAFATLGAFTGDPVLGQWGRGEMESVREQAQALRKARQEATEAERCRPSGNPAYMLCGGQPVPMPGWAEQQQDTAAREHAQAMELAQVKANTRLENALAKRQAIAADKAKIVPEATWRKVSEPLNWTQSLEGIIPLVEQSEDIALPQADVIMDWGRKMGLGGLVNLGEPMIRSGEAMSLRSIIQRVLTRLRAGEFGAALTKFEIEEFGKEDPLAAGVSKERLLDRLRRTVEFIKGQARTQIAGREAPGGYDISWLYQDPTRREAGVATPESTVTETPEGQATKTETTLPKGWTVKEK